MKPIFFIIFLFSTIFTQAQYITPNSNVNWNLDSLVAHSNGAVISTGVNTYQITQDLTIDLSDSFSILSGATVIIHENITLTIFGNFVVNDLQTTFTALDQNNPYRGFRFEEESNTSINNAILEYGGGLKVISSIFHLENSIIRNNQDILTTGAVIELSHGIPEIISNTFENNTKPAISSAGNVQVSPIIDNNIIQNNNTSNSNRPQINLGPSEENFQGIISNNIILGTSDNEMVGGIAISTLLGGVGNNRIENNEINNNRYGIAILGNNHTVEIINNLILDNNTQNEPMFGGSGINLNGSTSSVAILSSNTIEGNLWGITVQGAFEVNMGSPEIDGIISGENRFYNNGNGGAVYALYNNTPLDIQAPNNCWNNSTTNTLETAENVIFHNVDDNLLGTVHFNPLWNCYGVGIEENISEQITFYPNPTTDYFTINLSNENKIISYQLYNAIGKLIKAKSIISNEKVSLLNESRGIYFLKINGKNIESSVIKIIKE